MELADKLQQRPWQTTASLMMKTKQLFDQLLAWAADTNHDHPDFIEKLGSLRNMRLKSLIGAEKALQEFWDTEFAAVVPNSDGWKHKSVVLEVLQRARQQLEAFWDTQTQVYDMRSKTVCDKLQPVMLGGTDGAAWYEKAKPAVRKKWNSFLGFAKNTLFENMNVTSFKEDLDEAKTIMEGYQFLGKMKPVNQENLNAVTKVFTIGYGTFVSAMVIKSHLNQKDDSEKSRKILRKCVLDVVKSADSVSPAIMNSSTIPKELKERIGSLQAWEF